MRTDKRIMNRFSTVALTAAAVAVLLLQASCRKHHHEIIEEYSIRMSALEAGTTRALVNNVNDLGAQSVADNTGNTGFGVIGYKSVPSREPTLIFPNQLVTASGTTGNYTWSYTPTKYWDLTAGYHFLAYWPYSENIAPLAGTQTFTLPNWQPVDGTEDDWLIATSSGTASEYLYPGSGSNHVPGTVYFTFEHLLAMIEIQAWYYGNKDKKAVITDLILGDNSTNTVPDYSVQATSATSTSVSRDYSDDDNDNVWSTPVKNGKMTLLSSNTAELAKFSFDENGIRAEDETNHVKDNLYTYNASDDDYTTPVTDLDSDGLPLPDQVCRWLVVPFTTTGANIPLEIRYKVDGLQMPDATVTTGLGNVVSGKRYIIRIRINTNTNTIQVQNVWVKDWGTPSVEDKEVYNW